MEDISDTDSHASDSISPSDWAQVEEDLHRLCALQTEASHRMEALRMALALEESGWIPTIHACHVASMDELEQTGEVTFGARLLEAVKAVEAVKVLG